MKRAILATAATVVLCAAAIAQQGATSGRSQSVPQSGESRHQMQMQAEGGAAAKGFVADIENLTPIRISVACCTPARTFNSCS